MRAVLTAALLFGLATAAEAQDAPRGDDPAPVTASEPVGPVAPTPPPPTVTAPELPSAAPAAPALAGERQSEHRDSDAAAVQQIPRNFWWLVGGIVLAGVILAVLL